MPSKIIIQIGKKRIVADQHVEVTVEGQSYGEGKNDDLRFTFTDEGLVMEVIDSDGKVDGEQSDTYDELHEQLANVDDDDDRYDREHGGEDDEDDYDPRDPGLYA